MVQEIRKIDLNKASAPELTKIPSIDQSEAQKIIDYREARGGFKSVDELDKIVALTGFGIEDIRKYVTVGGPE